ncbi:hypothetical protein [Nocardioides sp.]
MTAVLIVTLVLVVALWVIESHASRETIDCLRARVIWLESEVDRRG